MAIQFDPLWLNPNNHVICRRKDVQRFVLLNINAKGDATIAVQGKVRLICWESLGAGLYRVFTQEME